MRDETGPRGTVDPGPDRSWVAEQLAAARARQEPEDQPPALPPLGEAFRELAAEWGETVLIAWNGPRGRDLRLAVRAGAHAALAAVATWLAAITLCVTVWLVSAPDTAGVGGPLQVGGQLWLLGHHAALDVPAGRVAFAPLGFTALLILALWQTTVVPVARPVHIAYAAFGSATGYCLVASLVAAGSTTADVHPDTAQAALFAVLFGALVPTAARWRRIIGFCDLPGWLVTAAKAAAAGGAVLVATGALTLAAMLALHMPQTGWPHGVLDEAGMLLLCLALLPNAIAWSASFLLGPGFAVGTGTGVSILSVKIGALPTLPMLGALPRNGSRIFPYDLAFLMLPSAAGVVMALVVMRAGYRRLGERMRTVGVAVLAVALAAGLLATLSGGPLAGGRMATLGPSGWRTAAATLLLPGLTAAVMMLARPSALVVRRLPRLALLVFSVAVLEGRTRLGFPDVDDREQTDRQGGERGDPADGRHPAVDQAADSSRHPEAEEDVADDPGLVVPGAGGQGGPEPEPEPGADEADEAGDDDDGGVGARVGVDRGVGVTEGPHLGLDGAEPGEPDDHGDPADAHAGEHQVDGDPD